MSGFAEKRTGAGSGTRPLKRGLSFHAKLADARQRREALTVEPFGPADPAQVIDGDESLAKEEPALAASERKSSRAGLALAATLAITLIGAAWSMRPGSPNAASLSVPEETVMASAGPAPEWPELRPVPRPELAVARPADPGATPAAPALPSSQARELDRPGGDAAISPPPRPAALGLRATVQNDAPVIADRAAPAPRPVLEVAGPAAPPAISRAEVSRRETDNLPLVHPVVLPSAPSTDLAPVIDGTSLPDLAAAEGPSGPVIFHTPNRSAQDQLDALRTDAALAGFDLGKAHRQPMRIRDANVRYFHEEDRAMAALLAEATGAELRDFTWFRPQPAIGTLELWAEGRSGLPAAEPERPGVFAGIRRDLGLIRRDIANLLRGNR
jgi:hypothetical protein